LQPPHQGNDIISLHSHAQPPAAVPLPLTGPRTYLSESTSMGQPKQLTPAFVMVASEEASYISGAVVPVTGRQPTL
jgi:hypothetical protein